MKLHYRISRTYAKFVGATAIAAGVEGLVPAPPIADKKRYLSGGGSWELVPEIYTPASPTLAGSEGLVPAPAAGNEMFLSSRRGWAELANFGYPTVSSPGTAGLVPAPSLGAPGTMILTDGGWAMKDAAPTVFKGAAVGSAGGEGLVPAPGAGTRRFLSSDGGWAEVTAGSSYGDMTAATSAAAGTSGLVPAPKAGDQRKLLTGSGTWRALQAAEPHDPTQEYAAGALVMLGPIVAVANANCPANTDFQWGKQGATWKPYLTSGATDVWAGVYAGTATLGDVVASTKDSIYFYLCIADAPAGTTLNNRENFIPWLPGLRLADVLAPMQGATASAAGRRGLVPTPKSADVGRVLYGSGEWKDPITYSTMQGANVSQAGSGGLVPAPGAGVKRFLASDGAWTEITFPTYSVMQGATTSAAGQGGLVPAPALGPKRWLDSEGGWTAPPAFSFSFADLKNMIGSNLAESRTALGFYDTAGTWNKKQTFAGSATELGGLVGSLAEKVGINAATGAVAIAYYTSAQCVMLLTGLTANARLEVSHSLTALLNAALGVGESLSFSAIVQNGTTAYIVSEVKIDGAVQTVKWVDGTAPTAGTVSGADVYCYTVIKTANQTYTVLGSFTPYK